MARLGVKTGMVRGHPLGLPCSREPACPGHCRGRWFGPRLPATATGTRLEVILAVVTEAGSRTTTRADSRP
jgi:hypothetical protein